jgi:hypothetical protein
MAAVVGSGALVVVAGVVSADVVSATTVVATASVGLGSVEGNDDGEPHDTATKPIAARTATLRTMSMCEVWPRCEVYAGSFTTASPRCSMSARSQ